MNKERGSGFAPRMLVWLIFASGIATATALTTMALVSKDRKVGELVRNLALSEEKNTELLSSILSCANGSGLSVTYDDKNSTYVDCAVKFEWVNGKYFDGMKGRKIHVSPRSR